MRILHLTILVFCQVLLASFILYSALASASPVGEKAQKVEPRKEPAAAKEHEPKQSGPVEAKSAVRPVEVVGAALHPPSVAKEAKPVEQPVRQAPQMSPVEPVKAAVVARPAVKEEPAVRHAADNAKVEEQLSAKKLFVGQATPEVAPREVIQRPVASPVSAPVVEAAVDKQVAVEKNVVVAAPVAPVSSPVKEPAGAPVEPAVAPVQAPESKAPVVKGGLGPLHLLAATLCSYQPERPVADETLNLLYSQRAALRKSLFDFMSLKFTNLEKLSSRLNPGFSSLEVVPQKSTADAPSSGGAAQAPSHGWPVVGKCTAHDLRLMAEAAWCDGAPSSPVSPVNQPVAGPAAAQASPAVQVAPAGGEQQVEKQEPKVMSNQHMRARSLDPAVVASEQASSVISKILHVNDVKDAPVIESSLVNSLNATQRQQLASAIQQAVPKSTRECRRTALRLTKALFNHLAEDQKDPSESWPLLYSQMAEDECARKRMIDVVTALSNFRGDATGSIRRDNVEYAFAMDDLRAKVLENEVTVPLTFDKQFIEVEQFLQQSVKLMLANIDPERARLTSMRYRSLMPGPLAADDQCIELHQRLLAKNHPTDCNPSQFGQLPDVLRMAANSLALWSVETELSKHSSKIGHEYPLVSVAAPLSGSSSSNAHPVKQDINECIANLVAK